MVHRIVQEEAREQEWETTLTQAAIHAMEEDRQGPMGQEEHSPQEEAIQEAIQEAIKAPAAHHPAPHHHSSEEEQVIQVARRRAHLQAYLTQEDILIRGLH